MSLVSELRPFRVVDDLADDELEALAAHVASLELEPGATLVEEGDRAVDLYLVQRGLLEVVKNSSASRRPFVIDSVSAGDVVGELALLDQKPRSSTVRAVTACRLLRIPFPRLAGNDEAGPVTLRTPAQRAAYRKLALNLAVVVTERLRQVADASAAAAQKERAIGGFIISTFTLLSLYLLLIGGLPELEPRLGFDKAMLSFPVQLAFAFGSVLFIRRSGYPLSMFGIGVTQLLPSVFEALLFTVPFLAVVTGLKWLVLQLNGNAGSLPLFEHPDLIAQLSSPHVQTWLGIYTISSLVQELIVRGALQSGLELFLAGTNRSWWAIFVAALLFAVTHLHLGFVFALAAFIPGAFWSWLFHRRRNLFGVTLSHVVVGSYVFFVLGAAVA